MKRCENCNIIVYDQLDVCPLCHSVLYEAEEKGIPEALSVKGAPYPDVRKRTRRLQFVMRLMLFLFIVSETGLIIINYYTTPDYWWSGISGAAMIYTYMSMIYWFRHDAGYAAKVGLQLIFTMALLLLLDVFTGMSGWSYQWAIPGIILFGDAVVFFLMMLNRQQWYSYTLLLFLIALCSVAVLVLYITGKIQNVVLPVVCTAVTGVYLLGTVIFGDREITRELKRRFHV